MIPADYRQNWLAVAAGDRPVRCLTTPNMTVSPTMTLVPSNVVFFSPGGPNRENARFSSTGYASYNGSRYHARHRRSSTVRRTTTARYTMARHHARHHRHRAAVASSRRYRRSEPARYTAASYATAQPPTAAAPAAEVTHMTDEAGRDLYQIDNTWYTESNGTWTRSDSWRGPFVHVRTGTVPREVREIPEKHRHDWGSAEAMVQ
jgi:hypothetical protein